MKRYDLQAGDGNLYWEEDPKGEWVKFFDADEQSQRNLNRAIDAETELRKAKELLTEWMAAAKSRIISDGLGDKTKSMIES